MKCMRKYFAIGILTISIIACNNAANEEAKMKEEQKKSDSIMQAAKHEKESSEINTTGLKFAQDTDPVCEMSIKDGVADTATVNGKLYGFCSPVCKEDFVKNAAVKK